MALRPTDIPPEHGTYLLTLCASGPVSLTVGKLGRVRLSPGFYYYTGSAFGSGGLRARLGRHLRRSKAQRWHIDYLRGKTALAGAYWLVDDARKTYGSADSRPASTSRKPSPALAPATADAPHTFSTGQS